MIELQVIAYSALAAAFGWLVASPRVAEPLYRPLLFEPHKHPKGNWSVERRFSCTPEDHFFTNLTGNKLHGWLFKKPDAQTTVLLNHGNTGNIADLDILLNLLLAAPINLFVYDYSGYGRSEGAASVAGVCEDAVCAYDYIAKALPDLPIVIYGESLGGSISSYVAQRRKIAGLILQSAFIDLRTIGGEMFPLLKMWPPLLFAFPYLDNISGLSKIKCPLLLIHGQHDPEVPLQHARTLYASAEEPKQLVILPNTEHEDISNADGDLFVATISEYLERLRSAALTVTPSLIHS